MSLQSYSTSAAISKPTSIESNLVTIIALLIGGFETYTWRTPALPLSYASGMLRNGVRCQGVQVYVPQRVCGSTQPPTCFLTVLANDLRHAEHLP